MEDIKINEKDGKITHSTTTTHNEDSLIEKYRRENMAFKIQEAKLEQLPAVIANMEMGLKLTEKQLEIGSEKEKQLMEIFDEMNLNLVEELREIRKNFEGEKLLEHAESIIKKTESEIVKEGSNYIFKSRITQTKEDLLIELMSIQDRKIDLLESNIKQETQLRNTRTSKEGMEKLRIEILERMKTIKLFFAKRHKNIDNLLDAKAKGRTEKQKTAQEI